ncbi:signal transduction histidine kinase [Flavobacterium sp. 7E]|uniref:tetratricopeptide repeat-containing sensor histidine kinase n=1 Tax=Flavobacterium sp. 7E TaxID=2735898 RepID=UPI0020C6AEED|nr:tetratricopeptide repeat-containing sensor histidine kinase [Flavobacterium sp. 7E]NRS89197.1 signal transduction histidine kinase [Flavobacterium sp. 7E]
MSFYIQAQIDHTHQGKNISIASPELQEKRLVTQFYTLYNSGHEKEALKEARLFVKKGKYLTNITNALLLQAYYYSKRAVLDSSFYYINNALTYNTKQKNDSLKNRLSGLVYNLKAILSKKKGLLDESKKWHLKGLVASQKYNETNLYYTHLHGLANIYKEKGDDINAIKLFKKCLLYKEDDEICLGSYINLGDIYSRLKEYKKANSYYNEGVVLTKKTNNIYAHAVINLSLGNNYQLNGDFNEAMKLFNEAILISKKHEFHQISLFASGNIGAVYIDLKRYNEAKNVFVDALKKAVQFGYLDNQVAFYDGLTKIAVLKSEYKTAFSYLKKSTKIKDSIIKMQQINEINELEIKYNTAQRKKEIEILQFDNATKKLELEKQSKEILNRKLQELISSKVSENTILFLQNSSERKRNEIALLKKDQELKALEIIKNREAKWLLILGFLIVIIPIVGLLFLYYKNFKNQRLLNKQQSEISAQRINSILKDQELKLIKASITGQDTERERISQELHDSIGGNIAAIKLQLNYSYKSNSVNIKNINDQLDETYQQVRDLSHTIIPKKFTLNKFCEVLESYIKNLGEASDIRTSFNAYPKKDIDAVEEKLQVEIFKIIQELFTNTIKHAKASSVDLQLNLVDSIFINVLFEDNGVGFNTGITSNGIGFINLNNRINNLGGSFLIDSVLKRGTVANIEIPIIEDNKR